MKYIRTKIEDHIYHILLDRGKSNAMDLEAVQELISAVEQAEADPAVEGLILSGKEGFFSSGLDLITLYDYDAEQMKEFWKHFLLLIQKLASFSKPAVSAITGHSPAGGCILALCCDYRIMTEGQYIIGLNEVPVGIVVPQSIFKLYSFWLGDGIAYRSLMEGKLFSPQEALAIGLVDEVVPLNRIQNTAFQKIKSVAQFEKNAWRSSKQNFRRDLVTSLMQLQEETIDQVLAQWWRPGTRAIMKTIIENLTQNRI
ncbi:enoyl-CoA hydratase/isomerase family protein [Parapedobacter sp. SGR-10]|uniref:enoyl-CoA hydratase/isomerase family protein n=1 Tax=Parapedobacter sp. SGR-10 TaxID=2710879 RepID=UPI0013D080CE|nr:enoyl-CoA hydratase/isomerase family protein [Parapedobacter sp. SGR-10]NGF55347.1 enoyl-CoA hydratase/isomerase family protein [Parapedobacter sp. SGR-10]